MFQTELHHFIQSFSNNFFDSVMVGFTSLGYTEFFLPMLLVLMFGVDFRKGIYIAHVLVLTGLISELLKNVFALPRPFHVDSAVKMIGKDYSNSSAFTGMGAKSFFGCLPPDVVEYYRAKLDMSYGLPSGHTSTALVLWGSIIYFFKKWWVISVSAMLIFFVPFSRIYLGRHFLADVLAGYTVGIIVFIAALLILYKNKFDFDSMLSIKFSFKKILILFYLVGLPLAFIILFPEIHPRVPGILLGINLVYLIFINRGLPKSTGNFKKRAAGAALSIIIFLGILFLVTQLTKILDLSGNYIKFISTTFVTFTGFFLSAIVNIKLKLMEAL